MGSTGYLTCGICWQCGKCYPRKHACPACGAPINLDDNACAACGEPVTDAQRLRVQEAFKQEKLEEFRTAMGSTRAAAPQTAPPAAVCPSKP